MVEGHDGEKAAHLMASRGKTERAKRKRGGENVILAWVEEKNLFLLKILFFFFYLNILIRFKEQSIKLVFRYIKLFQMPCSKELLHLSLYCPLSMNLSVHESIVEVNAFMS